MGDGNGVGDPRRTCTPTSHSILLNAAEEVRGNQPYRAARTLSLLAWPSASFLERITWRRERKGEPGGCILDFAAYTTIITDVFVIPEFRRRL